MLYEIRYVYYLNFAPCSLDMSPGNILEHTFFTLEILFIFITCELVFNLHVDLCQEPWEWSYSHELPCEFWELNPGHLEVLLNGVPNLSGISPVPEHILDSIVWRRGSEGNTLFMRLRSLICGIYM